MTIDHVVAAPRCAAYARSEDLGPRGTAGSYDGFLLVEHPLPWERDVTKIPGLQPVTAVADGSPLRYRVQALVPQPGSAGAADDAVTVIHLRRPADRPFAAYDRSEHRIPRAEMVQRCAELVADDPTLRPTDGHDGHGAPSTGEPIDLLVCTHGRRDLCCGSSGTSLYIHLPAFRTLVRAWRTSHTGGHRFAPTAVVLPQGTMWAYLDERTIAGIVDRTLPPDEAATLYRGCTGLDGPEVQALDAAVLAEVGWDWLARPRVGGVIEREGDNARVRLDADAGGDGDGDGNGNGNGNGNNDARWEATVVVVRRVPILDCGNPVDMAKSLQPELRVDELRRLTKG